MPLSRKTLLAWSGVEMYRSGMVDDATDFHALRAGEEDAGYGVIADSVAWQKWKCTGPTFRVVVWMRC